MLLLLLLCRLIAGAAALDRHSISITACYLSQDHCTQQSVEPTYAVSIYVID